MLKDAVSTRRYLKGRERMLPMPIYTGHPVAMDPRGDPGYIDGQVADIMIELQEAPLRPFTEGEPIGTIDGLSLEPQFLFGVTAKQFNQMSARVWTDHARKSKREKRAVYTTRRRVGKAQFMFTWMPDQTAFKIERM